MQDFIFSNLASQELPREARNHQYGDFDPDEMYKDEMWGSLYVGSSFKDLIQRIASWFTRRKAARKQGCEVKTGPRAQSTQCAPQV